MAGVEDRLDAGDARCNYDASEYCSRICDVEAAECLRWVKQVEDDVARHGTAVINGHRCARTSGEIDSDVRRDGSAVADKATIIVCDADCSSAAAWTNQGVDLPVIDQDT